MKLILLLVLLHDVMSGTQSGSYDKSQCTSRYEFRHELWENNTSTCEEIANKNPVCGERIDIAFSEHPPYIWYGKEDNKMHGILPGMIEAALKTCCGSCFHVKYHKYNDDYEKLTAENSTLILPIQASTKTEYYFGHDYVHIIEVEGVTFFGPPRKQDPNQTTATIFKAVFSTWPLFVIAFVMAVTAGIFIWLLDNHRNKDEFPASFLKGPFEGFWWAVVSMTTVGYGDRAPKSIIGRIFAMLWIIVGITIFSMYTAALTSSLTTSFIAQNEVNLQRMKIGILKTTAVGKSTVIKMNARYNEYHDIGLIREAFLKNEIDVACLDDNIVYDFIKDLTRDGITDYVLYEHREVQGFSYGMLSNSKNATTFFKTFYENNNDQMEILLQRTLGKTQDDPQLQSNSIDAGEIFSATKMFYICLVSLVIISILLLLISFGVKKIKGLKNTESEDTVELKNIDRNGNAELLHLVEQLRNKLHEEKC